MTREHEIAALIKRANDFRKAADELQAEIDRLMAGAQYMRFNANGRLEEIEPAEEFPDDQPEPWDTDSYPRPNT